MNPSADRINGSNRSADRLFSELLCFFLLLAGLLTIPSAHGSTDASDFYSRMMGTTIEVKEEKTAAIVYRGEAEKARVLKIIDGDTLHLSYMGREIKVRLIGVDTPESYSGGKANRDARQHGSKVADELALGKKAKASLASLLRGVSQVDIRFGVEKRDKYDRYLCYVFLPGGLCVNEELIRRGMARVLMIAPNDEHRREYMALFRKAVKDKVGIWALKGPEATAETEKSWKKKSR